MSDRLPREFAPGVYQLPVGNGLLRANVYFVRGDAITGGDSESHSTSPWTLVDTGVSGCDIEIREAAASLFGPRSAPSGIVITHAHPDHVGSAADLARHWECAVYLHADEMRMITGDLSHFQSHSFALDRWLILPILKRTARKHLDSLILRDGLHEFAQALNRADEGKAGHAIPVPGLPDWVAIPTPGHTPGHVALFRERDRVLLSGDSVVTKAAPLSMVASKRGLLSRSPWYFTWSQKLTKDSLITLAGLEPSVIASGHGLPQEAMNLAAQLRSLASGR